MKLKGDYYHSIAFLIGVLSVLMIIVSGEGCSHQERSALLQLKPLFNPDKVASWDNKTINTSHSDCCDDWAGVKCSSHGRVTSLHLSKFGYSLDDGYLYNNNWHFNVSVLRPFQHLQHLDLSDNSIVTWSSGNTTDVLLPHLELLDLSHNYLDNSFLSNLTGFSSLKHLLLESNNLSGLLQLPDIEALINLEELNLNQNTITGLMDNDGCGKMHKLQTLLMAQNELANLPSCLGRLTSLEVFYLSSNQLAGNIPSWFENFKSLGNLYLSNNHFTGNIDSSPIIHLHSLEILDISYNYFEIPLSFKPFANLTKLKEFEGCSNQVIPDKSRVDNQTSVIPRFQLKMLSLSNCALKIFPPFLFHQHDLEYMDLSDNVLEVKFPTWLLENNQRLGEIHLGNNSLTGELHMPSSTHAYISYIELYSNKLGGHLAQNIGVAFPNLSELDASNNELQGNIPSTMCDIKPLQLLYLQNNNLSRGLQHLTHACLNLSYLDLSNNNFQGDLPSFHGLPSLVYLNLNRNNLSGHVTVNNFNPSLVILDLSNNSLEGSIPEFDRHTALKILKLSHNKLNGTLPSCLSSIGPYVSLLYLNDNRLNGPIHDVFCNNSSLVALDVSNNDLSGPIPTSIANFNSLSFLILRGNQFHDQIPAQLCNLQQLIILDLSNNNLSGSIPHCLWKPNFGGSTLLYNISEAFSVPFTTKGRSYDYLYYSSNNWGMSGIDLSCNQLTGEIPLEFGNMSHLHGFNISHNKLRGRIPGTFSKMKQLESLDLSYNNLNGPIPPQVSKLDNLEVFNVAYNNLSGKIPFEAHSMTIDASSYEGNLLLCGPPLSINCNPHKSHITGKEVEEGGWIDMETFYISSIGSGIVMFFTVIIIIWLNPRC